MNDVTSQSLLNVVPYSSFVASPMACRAGLLDELSFIDANAVFAKDTVVMFDVVYYTQLAVRMFHYRATSMANGIS